MRDLIDQMKRLITRKEYTGLILIDSHLADNRKEKRMVMQCEIEAWKLETKRKK